VGRRNGGAWEIWTKIKKELEMPEYTDWQGQDRLRVNIDTAWKVANN
jgi:hypothetical protein